jgi:hypothetical protein
LWTKQWSPSPGFFVSVASKELRFDVSGLESTLMACLASVDSKVVTDEYGIPLHRSVEMQNAGAGGTLNHAVLPTQYNTRVDTGLSRRK